MDYLKSLSRLHDLTKFGINLGLERIKNLLRQVGDPQDALSVIHIGGTNGKGSTAAMLTAVLKEAGYRVGTYTSPHLRSYTERIMLNNQPIPEQAFADLLEEFLPLFEQVRIETGENPTEFEVLTAMAFLYFLRCRAEVVILEVGLGGDIDSTNVIKKPVLSIITNVDIDHVNYLGKSLREIAEKKSGIIKSHCPVITASCADEVLQVLCRKAEQMEAPCLQVFREVFCRSLRETEDGQYFTAKTGHRDWGELYIPLQGEHQLANAATAILALEVLVSEGWEVTREHLVQGMKKVYWPGRLEVVRKRPLIVLDGAHNPAGMEFLSRWLERKKPGYSRVILVIGMLADKDRARSVEYLAPYVDQVIITKPLSPRAGNWQELKQYFQNRPKGVIIIEKLTAALQKAIQSAGSQDMVLVTGSLYLIGEARGILTS